MACRWDPWSGSASGQNARAVPHCTQRNGSMAQVRSFLHRDGVGRAALGADAAQNARTASFSRGPLSPAGAGFCSKVQDGLGLLEQRLQRHAAQFEASHIRLPFGAANARVDGQDDHVDVGQVAPGFQGRGHTGQVLRRACACACAPGSSSRCRGRSSNFARGCSTVGASAPAAGGPSRRRRGSPRISLMISMDWSTSRQRSFTRA